MRHLMGPKTRASTGSSSSTLAWWDSTPCSPTTSARKQVTAIPP
eukprot:CAMPEP_0173207580 /NCGR_PEP_ID=MMETSP1141-20130122/22010_1 /TAXON_ID=483371 /ORGANISM="non described non described, Strain CCMP2298" /LENGTH=43 /DNA_ID= /DNA_START= /DNA_END= /DNA_ORIENTATION=